MRSVRGEWGRGRGEGARKEEREVKRERWGKWEMGREMRRSIVREREGR